MKYHFFENYIQEACKTRDIEYIEPFVATSDDEESGFLKWEIEDKKLMLIFENNKCKYYKILDNIIIEFGRIDSLFDSYYLYEWATAIGD